MKRIKNFLIENLMTLIVLGIAIWIQNWYAALGWGMVLFLELHMKTIIKWREEDMAEIDKWHRKYMEAKYGTKQQS